MGYTEDVVAARAAVDAAQQAVADAEDAAVAAQEAVVVAEEVLTLKKTADTNAKIAVTQAHTALTDAQEDLAYLLAHPPIPPVVSVPGQVVGKTIVGMATDNYATRVAELGRPVGADHFFVSSWSISSFMTKLREVDSKGLLAYGNMKVINSDWKRFGSAAADAEVTALANELAKFGKPVRVTFHHEPGFKTPTALGEGGYAQDWVNMAIRQYPRIKAIAPNVVTGCCINGFIMDPRSDLMGWTFAELNSVFTDKFFDSIDAFGGDYYDGSSSRAKAETGVGRAFNQINNADKWLRSRGLVGSVVADVGEFNFIKPEHALELTNFFTTHTDLWWLALVYNSDLNNRDNIPTIGARWNFSHGYNSQWDRRDAFRRMLDDAKIVP